MQLLFEALTYHRDADAPWSVLVILLVRVTLVLVAALLAGQVLRRSSAAVLHQLWAWALLGTLAVPAVWAITPSWRLPLVTLQVSGAGYGTMPAAAAAPSLASNYLLVGTWLAGTLIGLTLLLLGILQARRTLALAAPCQDARWLLALALAKRELGFTRRVELRMTNRPISPAVWGFFRTRVLLPTGADHWSLAQRRSVLLHELAHVPAWRLLLELPGGRGFVPCGGFIRWPGWPLAGYARWESNRPTIACYARERGAKTMRDTCWTLRPGCAMLGWPVSRRPCFGMLTSSVAWRRFSM